MKNLFYRGSVWCLIGVFCPLIASGPAKAQYGGAVAAAIGGAIAGMGSSGCSDVHNIFAEDTTARIRRLSENSLKAYLSLAATGSAVDARPVFTTKKPDLHWSRDGQLGDVGAVDDPIARSLAATAGSFDTRVKGEQFLIGRYKFSTMGIWRVFAADDPSKVIGSYRAQFWRHNTLGGQTWDLIHLELITGPAEPANIIPYCMEPGDHERYLAAVEKDKAERARKKAEKAAAARR